MALEVDPAAAAKPEPAPTVPPPPAGPSTKTLAGVTSLGVGGVGLAVGGVFGILAMSKKSALDAQCINKACPVGTQATIDTANTYATLSTVGFAVGGVGIAAGIVLLALPTKAAAAVKATGVTPIVGMQTLGVAGTF